MKHTIHIFILLMLSQSSTLANFVVCGHSGIYASTSQDSKKPAGVDILSITFRQNISSHDHEDLYRLIQNNDQDTSKTNSGKVLFGRSFLKSHYELHGKKGVVDQEKRTQWIRKSVDSLMLRRENDLPQLVKNELIHEDFYRVGYRLIEKGMINFEDGSYIKLMSTSAHAISEIGDITLAVDAQGSVYINQGHICGRIIHFNTHQRGVTHTEVEFLKNFTSDTDDVPSQVYIQVQNKKQINKTN